MNRLAMPMFPVLAPGTMRTTTKNSTVAARLTSTATLGRRRRYHIFTARLASIFRASTTPKWHFTAFGLRASCLDFSFFASPVWIAPFP